jgi:hypothetical protein
MPLYARQLILKHILGKIISLFRRLSILHVRIFMACQTLNAKKDIRYPNSNKSMSLPCKRPEKPL